MDVSQSCTTCTFFFIHLFWEYENLQKPMGDQKNIVRRQIAIWALFFTFHNTWPNTICTVGSENTLLMNYLPSSLHCLEESDGICLCQSTALCDFLSLIHRLKIHWLSCTMFHHTSSSIRKAISAVLKCGWSSVCFFFLHSPVWFDMLHIILLLHNLQYRECLLRTICLLVCFWADYLTYMWANIT